MGAWFYPLIAEKRAATITETRTAAAFNTGTAAFYYRVAGVKARACCTRTTAIA